MINNALVHVVDDDADVRASLSLLLESVGIEVVGYVDGDSFLQAYRPTPERPSCLLLDIRMPGLSGMAVLKKFHTEGINLPVIILTGHGDIPMSVNAMKLGAVDFLTKPFNHQRLLDLVQNVLRDPLLQGQQDSNRIDPREAQSRWETLTPREKEIFQAIVSGSSNKVIGIELNISTRTVETHRARIMEKLEARSLVDLVLLNLSLRNSN
ncbi:MAG: response regulator [Chromatiales bacterium]